MGGAEPGTGFPELLLLLGRESGNGLGLGPPDPPLFCVPTSSHCPPRFGFLCPTGVGLGTWTPHSISGPSSPQFRPVGLSAFGQVLSPGRRGVLPSAPGAAMRVEMPEVFAKRFPPTRLRVARVRRGPRLGPVLGRSVWHRRASRDLQRLESLLNLLFKSLLNKQLEENRFRYVSLFSCRRTKRCCSLIGIPRSCGYLKLRLGNEFSLRLLHEWIAEVWRVISLSLP